MFVLQRMCMLMEVLRGLAKIFEVQRGCQQKLLVFREGLRIVFRNCSHIDHAPLLINNDWSLKPQGDNFIKLKLSFYGTPEQYQQYYTSIPANIISLFKKTNVTKNMATFFILQKNNLELDFNKQHSGCILANCLHNFASCVRYVLITYYSKRHSFYNSGKVRLLKTFGLRCLGWSS